MKPSRKLALGLLLGTWLAIASLTALAEMRLFHFAEAAAVRGNGC